jgi:hypothetical protein
MAINPVTKMKDAFGAAVEWRVRDRLIKEREALVELGTSFIDIAAEISDRLDAIERRLDALEKSQTTQKDPS